jgi:hypothetical protein
MSSLVIQFETIRESLEDFKRLSAEECAEIHEERPVGADWRSMAIVNENGNFKVLVARVDDEMVGYFSFFIDFDMESYGTLIVNQSAWYVRQGYPTIGVRLFDRAMNEFKKLGVKFVYLHHPVYGRGAKLGSFFERRGGKLLGYNYVINMKNLNSFKNGLYWQALPQAQPGTTSKE